MAVACKKRTVVLYLSRVQQTQLYPACTVPITSSNKHLPLRRHASRQAFILHSTSSTGSSLCSLSLPLSLPQSGLLAAADMQHLAVGKVCRGELQISRLR